MEDNLPLADVTTLLPLAGDTLRTALDLWKVSITKLKDLLTNFKPLPFNKGIQKVYDKISERHNR